MAGRISLYEIPTYALFDSGSTHSFISNQHAAKIGRKHERLDFDLIVSQPMSKGVKCSTVLRDCEANIGGISMGIDLIPLGMSHFDVIIGMDWLTKFKAKIDCVLKAITFEEPKGG